MGKKVKIYVVILAVLFAASSGFSRQWWSADTLAKAGVKAGVSWANLSNSNNLLSGFTQDPNFWFTVSAWASHDLKKDRWALQSEFVYIRGGKQWEVGGGNHLTLNIDYIQMPAFLKLMFPMGGFVPDVYLGPFISYAYRAATRNLPATPPGTPFFNSLYYAPGGTVTVPPTAPGPSSDIDFARNPFDIGFVAGLGFKVALDRINWDLDFRYNYGALNAFNFPAGSGVRNYMFQVMTGFSFNLRPKCECARVRARDGE